jgi:molecular chaperone HtpG
MQTGKIGVTSENIFPIIKKFLYSDHEIFLRELISNAVDATKKLKTMSNVGDVKGELGDLTIRVKVDKKKNTLSVSDQGIGMTSDEIEKYINQIAFSSAEEFLAKYKNQEDAMIGYFGLGFYSSFMVSDKVEIYTKSYKKSAKAIKWTCAGNPEYSIEEIDRKERGTEVILYLDKDSKEFSEENKINELLTKYCRFLPVEIGFGKEKEWKDGKQVELDKDKIINDTKPLWTRKPSDVKNEDYKKFYRDLYPISEEPLFNIHINVDYPFNLTGILYFPKIRNNIEIQKNKIQLYCNQVYVTDSVEGIVPEFLTLLHGVIDSPDIPLNVSRSFLQNDQNVKKISGHITKKVADKLSEIFKKDRAQFEKKWDDIKLFIEYGMISEEKFYEKAEKFALLKNTDGKYFTFEEYEKLIKANQTDRSKTLVYLYATHKDEQFSFIDAAKSKGYDVLMMDGQLDTHFINHIEQKFKGSRFLRVDSDTIDKLIPKEESIESKLTAEQKENLAPVFKSQLSNKQNYTVMFENLNETDNPVIITQSEFVRRMKDMSKLGGTMGFYGDMPDSYNLVINSNHPHIIRVVDDMDKKVGEKVAKLQKEIKPLVDNKTKMEKDNKDKKEEEIKQKDKDKIVDLDKNINKLKEKKEKVLSDYGNKNKLVKQLIDLALLANNMLKGEELNKFVKRSINLI